MKGELLEDARLWLQAQREAVVSRSGSAAGAQDLTQGQARGVSTHGIHEGDAALT